MEKLRWKYNISNNLPVYWRLMALGARSTVYIFSTDEAAFRRNRYVLDGGFT